ncbi:uncharacterized protein [Cardiocondyla obscurior]|uniref:uncharacterized protein n=1 Tax=Cardiocondyla obscurior TaxID=286306 RepID=UPI0039657A93
MEIPSNIKLADPEFHLPRPVELLIGSGATLSLFSIGQINLSENNRDLFLHKTRLGWIIAGDASIQSKFKTSSCYLTNIDDQITRFWEVEEINLNKPKSKEENDCEAFFVETTFRNSDGRYVVRLPFRDTDKRLGDSRPMAIKRLFLLERKLNLNPSLKSEYSRIIQEYKDLGHMSVIEIP